MFKIYSFIIIIITACFSGFTNAEEPNYLSSKRYQGESYQEAAKRNFDKEFDYTTSKVGSTSAYDVSASLNAIDFSALTDWGDKEKVDHVFLSGRDSRFIDWKNGDKEYPRRLSWLYPQDGCYLRAEVLKNKLIEFNYAEAKKLYVFGDLVADTNNTETGKVAWWFHVVVVVTVGEQVYVFDPAIDPSHVLILDDWISKLGADVDNLKFSLCDANTFGPFNSCDQPSRMPEFVLTFLNGIFLDLEWMNLNKLGREADDELQEHPPWRKQVHAWGVNRRKGVIGDIYIGKNLRRKKDEFFELRNVNANGEYGWFPRNRHHNHYWKYLGTKFNLPYLEPLHEWDEQTRRGRVGDIYVHENHYSGKTEYFLLSGLDYSGRYRGFPTNRSSNYFWKFIGNNYPVHF